MAGFELRSKPIPVLCFYHCNIVSPARFTRNEESWHRRQKCTSARVFPYLFLWGHCNTQAANSNTDYYRQLGDAMCSTGPLIT